MLVLLIVILDMPIQYFKEFFVILYLPKMELCFLSLPPRSPDLVREGGECDLLMEWDVQLFRLGI